MRNSDCHHLRRSTCCDAWGHEKLWVSRIYFKCRCDIHSSYRVDLGFFPGSDEISGVHFSKYLPRTWTDVKFALSFSWNLSWILYPDMKVAFFADALEMSTTNRARRGKTPRRNRYTHYCAWSYALLVSCSFIVVMGRINQRFIWISSRNNRLAHRITSMGFQRQYYSIIEVLLPVIS